MIVNSQLQKKSMPSSLKGQLNYFATQMVNGVPVSPETLIMVQRNYTRLTEMRDKNDTLYKQILDSKNKETTVLTLINNSSIGLELGEDFYFVNFKGKIGEIKTGRGWKNIAMKFSVEPIHYIKAFVFTKTDEYELKWDEETDSFKLKKYVVDLGNTENITYEDIVGAYGVIKFANGVKRTRILRKSEIDKIKSVSPSGGSEKMSKFSPWFTWPDRMVESKIYRDLVRREIELDNKKMAAAGYKLLEDDSIIEVHETDENEINVTNAAYLVSSETEKSKIDLVLEKFNNKDQEVILRTKQIQESFSIEKLEDMTNNQLDFILTGKEITEV